MVTRSILLAFLSFPILSHAVSIPGVIKRDEKAFTEIKSDWHVLPDSERAAILNKAFGDNTFQLTPQILQQQLTGLEDPQKFVNTLLTETKIQLNTEVLKDQYHSLEEPEEFLNTLLLEKTEIDRQLLINNLLEIYTNKDILTNPSEDSCQKIGDSANPIYAGAASTIDWLNTAHFKGFFQPALAYAILNRDAFNEFDSFNQWGFWAEPFGFYTKFRRDPAPLKFNMYTVGFDVGGEFIFFDRLILGLGAAYSYSHVDWQSLEATASLNSFYFGPSLSYVFTHGYLSCTLFGLANFYQVEREVQLAPEIEKPSHTTPDYTTWDFVVRLEGGLSYEAGRHFFLYPTAKVDYLAVFKQASTEKIDDDTEMSLKGFDESFFSSKVGLKAAREFLWEEWGYFIPSLSAGWIAFNPLALKSYQYSIEPCGKFEKKLKVGSWSQWYLGAGLALIHKKAILISFDYELTLGANSPLQAGSLRIEFNW